MTAPDLGKAAGNAIPLALLLIYFAFFGYLNRELGFNSSFEGMESLVFRVEAEALIHYRLALALWGSTLICFGAIGAVIVADSAMQLSRLVAPATMKQGLRLFLSFGTAALLSIIFWFVLEKKSLSGGFAHALYTRFASQEAVTLRNVFELMNSITVMTLIPALAVTLSLCGLIQETRASGASAGKVLAARLQRLLALTAVFLCVGIVQVYFQYQCLTVLLEDRGLAVRITSLMTLAMSIFYTGLSVTLFVPTGYLMHRLIDPVAQQETRKGDAPSSLPQNFLGGDLLHQLRSAGLLLAPLLTGLLAELPAILGDP